MMRSQRRLIAVFLASIPIQVQLPSRPSLYPTLLGRQIPLPLFEVHLMPALQSPAQSMFLHCLASPTHSKNPARQASQRERGCMQEAAEHRRRKAQIAGAQQEEQFSGELSPNHSHQSPAHGGAEIPWWPGERVIGGGPWSKLPRWRPDLDSPLPASPPIHTAAKIDSNQASRSRKMPGQQKPGQQIEVPGRPQSAPSFLEGIRLPAQPSQDSNQATSRTNHAHEQSNGECQSRSAQHIDQHHKLRGARRAQRAAQQQRSTERSDGQHEVERVVYVQRPSAQQQPRLAGSVPNFRELHAKWDAHLTAAKAAMHRRLTKPKVSKCISAWYCDIRICLQEIL